MYRSDPGLAERSVPRTMMTVVLPASDPDEPRVAHRVILGIGRRYKLLRRLAYLALFQAVRDRLTERRPFPSTDRTLGQQPNARLTCESIVADLRAPGAPHRTPYADLGVGLAVA